MSASTAHVGPEAHEHPRTLGWGGTVALAMGGSNQSLFIMGALLATQGTAAVPLLVAGLLLSWAALPGWTELILMWPRRVGGIAATCAEAFRPYSPVLANLAGVAYWWGWVPTCGLTAILSASALHEWYLPGAPVPLLASGIVAAFTIVNLAGVRWATRIALPVACLSAGLALTSAVVPVLHGSVDWARATSFRLDLPFHGAFGALTSAMAGLYLIGFAAPAFEAASCHVGETKDPERNVPRAMYGGAAMAGLYFLVLPVVWLGVLGPRGLQGQLMITLGPTFAPLLGGAAKAAAIWFMVFNMFHGTLQPLAGAARTLSQLSDDGLLPRMLGRRNRHDAPWVATTVTAVLAIAFLQSGDPPWVIAAANFCYLIGIGLPSVAVWLLRRNAPDMPRPYRAPRGTVTLGLLAALTWLASTFLGLEQFGLPTVLASLSMAYSGSVLFAWRRWRDHAEAGGAPGSFTRSLHAKLTGAMVAVMVLDGAGYLLAVGHVTPGQQALVAVLKDVFVAVAVLTVTVGLVLPGMISHAVAGVADAAHRLSAGTLADLTEAMRALARGDLAAASARADFEPVEVRSRDEVGLMARSFNDMQSAVSRAASALDDARDGLQGTRSALERSVGRQAAVAALGVRALEPATLDEVLANLLAEAAAVFAADGAALLELAEDGPTARLRAGVGLREEPGRQDIPLEPGGAVARIVGGEAQLVEDWAADGRWTAAPFMERAGVRASMAVRVPGRERPFGVIVIASRTPRTFIPEEVDCLQTVAALLAAAVDRDRSEQQMRHQALHDPLTGLPNRALVTDRLALALAHAGRIGRCTAVLFLDLDHFKVVNDSLGHGAGDDLLRMLAARLDAVLRPGDTVARFGGDEFVFICDDLADAADAEGIARRLIAVLDAPFTIAGREQVMTGSIGIAVAEGAGRAPEDLIREADAAMYRAKERGRNRWELYDEAMRSRALTRLRMDADLRAAVERDELRLQYQPVVELATGRIRGVEALVRWQHPERGLVPPGEFIPLAEETGSIEAIGEWVLRAAAGTAVAWRAAAPHEPPVAVAVNLSARQVARPDIVDVVAGVLAETGLEPALLDLEITETVLMEDPDASAQTLAALKALGVRIVLDDFGTGFSSLAYVRRFPIDLLKVDRAFVQDLGDAGADATIVEAVLSMARGLRVGVIAEGVETAQQAAALESLGCELAQGYLFARPLDAGDLEPRLRERLCALAR